MNLISVIVPIYKVEQYLDRCVESLVNQTYTNLEIILVDDGSPDDCPSMCDGWAKKDFRIKVIHKQNGGLSDARNAGMAVATGEYFAFVDSDDWVDKNFICFLYKAMQDTNAEVSACDVRWVHDDDIVEDEQLDCWDTISVDSKAAMAELLQGKGFRAVAWNKLYRRSILENESFCVGKLHEDEFFTYRIYDKAKILTYVNLPLYNYVQRSGSIMSTYSVRHLDVLDAYLERLELLNRKYPEMYRADKVSICVACINQYCAILIHGCEELQEAKKRIRNVRKKVQVSFSDLRTYTWKNRMYCVLSLPLVIEWFCRYRIWRGYTDE